MAHHLTSMIVHGTFEKFPDLKVVVAEEGIAWLPWLVTQLDANYELMTRESKWVKRRPSEYLTRAARSVDAAGRGLDR